MVGTLVKGYMCATSLCDLDLTFDLALFIYLFGVLRCFQHCTGHITTGSWKGRGNQYIQFVRVLHCKLPTNGKQLPAFPLEAVTGIEPRPQRWEARVLPLCHHGPLTFDLAYLKLFYVSTRKSDTIYLSYISLVSFYLNLGCCTFGCLLV